MSNENEALIRTAYDAYSRGDITPMLPIAVLGVRHES
jgi:hypothetical protein